MANLGENAYQELLESISLSVVMKARLDKDDLVPLLAKLRLVASESAHGRIDSLRGLTLATVGRAATKENYYLFTSLLEELKQNHPSESCDVAKVRSDKDSLTYDLETPKQVIQSFQSEVSGHLQLIEQKLIHLESSPADQTSLAAVFGSLHSMKGVCGFLCVASAQGLAHSAESLIAEIMKSGRGLLRSECDLLLKTVDVLSEIVQQISAHSNKPSQPLPPLPQAYFSVREGLISIGKSGLAEGKPVVAPESLQKRNSPRSASPNDPDPSRAETAAALVRVQVEKLDILIDTIGELVVTHSQIHQDPHLRGIDSPHLFRNLSQLNKITRDLQSVAMSLRMYPVREMFARITRIGRDLARQEQKEIEVVVQGADTEMDKNLIESMIDPLTHLIRNAVDHGVEPPEQREREGKPPCARIDLIARHQGGNVVIEVADDGRGLNLDRIRAKAIAAGIVSEDARLTDAQSRNLIFEPGLSTADKVTEISGRGVGLDVVKRNVQALNGRIAVSGTSGVGTRFELIMPLTLAIIDGLTVRVGSDRYIVPISSVVEAIRPNQKQVSTVQGEGELLEVRGEHLPIVRLADFAESSLSERRDASRSIVMLMECESERYGLLVDELLGQQQVVIKSLGERFQGHRGIAGGAILGDGRVGLVLDVSEVLSVHRHSVANRGPILNASAN